MCLYACVYIYVCVSCVRLCMGVLYHIVFMLAHVCMDLNILCVSVYVTMCECSADTSIRLINMQESNFCV